MINLEVGKCYLTRDGRNTGPMYLDGEEFRSPNVFYYQDKAQLYSPDGTVYAEGIGEEGHTIVAEVPPYTFTYRNCKRSVTPIRLEYAATDWHPEPQWLLIAWDNDKGAERSFAMKDINP